MTASSAFHYDNLPTKSRLSRGRAGVWDIWARAPSRTTGRRSRCVPNGAAAGPHRTTPRFQSPPTRAGSLRPAAAARSSCRASRWCGMWPTWPPASSPARRLRRAPNRDARSAAPVRPCRPGSITPSPLEPPRRPRPSPRRQRIAQRLRDPLDPLAPADNPASRHSIRATPSLRPIAWLPILCH